jgi:hypothetical protein
MKSIIKNKKGDIPITILVIGVVAICILAIFSFYFSDRKIKEDLNNIGIIEEAAVMKEKISFYRNLGFTEEEIAEEFGIKSESVGGFSFRYFTLSQEGVSVRYDIEIKKQPGE